MFGDKKKIAVLVHKLDISDLRVGELSRDLDAKDSEIVDLHSQLQAMDSHCQSLANQFFEANALGEILTQELEYQESVNITLQEMLDECKHANEDLRKENIEKSNTLSRISIKEEQTLEMVNKLYCHLEKNR